MATRILIHISIFLIFIPVVSAQDVPKKMLSIGVAASFEQNISSETVAFTEYTGFIADYNKLNYRLGLHLAYFVKANVTINGFLNYTNKDFTGTYFCHVCDFEFPPTPEDVTFRFIEAPVTFKYYFLPNKIRLFGEVGINNLFPLNNLNYEGATNSYVFGYKLGGGMEYNLSNSIALQLSVDYNNSVSKLFKDAHFKLKTVNVGIVLLKNI